MTEKLNRNPKLKGDNLERAAGGAATAKGGAP